MEIDLMKETKIVYEDDKVVAWEEYDPAQHIFDDGVNLWLVNEKIQ